MHALRPLLKNINMMQRLHLVLPRLPPLLLTTTLFPSKSLTLHRIALKPRAPADLPPPVHHARIPQSLHDLLAPQDAAVVLQFPDERRVQLRGGEVAVVLDDDAAGEPDDHE